jgi:predicted DsbA family dithiol-disulfide isomerase
MCVLAARGGLRHLARMRTIKVDLFADVICPWCLIGAARLDRAIAELPEGIAVDVENHPFYLDPDTPPEGYDVGEMLRAKYGRDPQVIWARAEAEATKAGIVLDLSKQPRTFRTAKVHTLVRLARAKGTQHAFANAVAEAYFLEYQPVNDDDVLAGIAMRFGFTREEALSNMHDAEALAVSHELAVSAAQQGIQGVPFFVFDGRFALSGAQPQDVFKLAFEKALEPA